MGQSDESHKVYNNLTETSKSPQKGKWTVYLFLCCLTACMGSFNFGFNIGALNLPTPLIKEFFAQRFAPDYYIESNSFLVREQKYLRFKYLSEDYSTENITDDQVQILATEKQNMFVEYNNLSLPKLRVDLETEKDILGDKKSKIDERNVFYWTITNSLFVFGGMFGAFSSKYVLEYFGRKKGLLFHYIFSTLAAIFALGAPHIDSIGAIGLVMCSRFFYGIQGGMMCGIVPTYLNEVAPGPLRGSCGVLNQLCITIGILFAQTLGFRQLLGTKDLWEYILAFPLITSLIGGFVLLFFFSETPKALLITNKDEDSTREVLQRLRNQTDVDDEIEELYREGKESGDSSSAVSFKELLTAKEFRWPLITVVVLQLTQQLCGINAIFFYSDGIFRRATIADEHIQYAIFATGFINVLCTIVVVPMIEKLGRKPLLVYPMCLMLIDFIFLTICLVLQESNVIFSYLSIFCIIIFICCFAVGLGPIPFIYATEVFRQDAKGAALAIAMTINWIANLILSLSFEYLAMYLKNYVFLVFFVVVAIAVTVIFKKVPETKNKSVEEVIAFFGGRKQVDDIEINETAKPMLSTSKV